MANRTKQDRIPRKARSARRTWRRPFITCLAWTRTPKSKELTTAPSSSRKAIRCWGSFHSHSRKQTAHDGADAFSIRPPGRFGLDGFDDGSHVFLARRSQFLDSGAHQLFQFIGGDRLEAVTV